MAKKNVLNEKSHVSPEAWTNAKGFIDELDNETIESIGWLYEKGGTGAIESINIKFVRPMYMTKKKK